MRGMNLKRIREARGLKQEDLAEMVGLTPSTISRAESMDDTAKLKTYRLCAKALGLTLADLFTEETDPMVREVAAIFREIPTEKRQQAIDLLIMAKGLSRA